MTRSIYDVFPGEVSAIPALGLATGVPSGSAPSRVRGAGSREGARGGRTSSISRSASPISTPRAICRGAGRSDARAGRRTTARRPASPSSRGGRGYLSRRTRDLSVDPGQVLVAHRREADPLLRVLATSTRATRSIYPDPGFPIYESVIRWAGATPVPLPLHEERDFVVRPRRAQPALGPRTKLVILNSPQNPTGGVLAPKETPRQPADRGRATVGALRDEVYSQIVYEGEFAVDRHEPACSSGRSCSTASPRPSR